MKEVLIIKKKIVILNGSPRANGNTVSLIQHFTEGAKAAGHQVTCFNLQEMNIHPCLGCLAGGTNPDSPCVQKDDMSLIYPAYKEADIVCFASPLYYWSVTGQLKCAMDRLFAVLEGNTDSQPKDCTLLIAAEGHEYEEVVYWYDNYAKHLGWTDKGKVICGGVYQIGDIKDNDKLNDAYQLGQSL